MIKNSEVVSIFEYLRTQLEDIKSQIIEQQQDIGNLIEMISEFKEDNHPRGKLEAIQPGPDKAEQRRKELRDRQKNVVIPQ